MPKIWLPKFDETREYVVNKPLLSVAGKMLFAGDPFDKSLVTTRRLRQLYELRKVALTKTEVKTIITSLEEPIIVRAGPVWRRVMLGDVQIGKSVKTDDEALEIIAAWKEENAKSIGNEGSISNSEGVQRETSDGNDNSEISNNS